MVGRTEHPPLGRDLVRPPFGFVVATALEGIAELELETSRNTGLGLHADAGDGGARRIAALLDDVALFVLADLFERKEVVEHRIEPLDEQISLHPSEIAVEVDRCAEAVRIFGPQVRVEADDGHLVVQRVDMQILVIGSLRHSFWKKNPVLRVVCRKSRPNPRYLSSSAL